MWVAYGVQQADKTGISTQALFNFRQDNHLVGQQYSWKVVVVCFPLYLLLMLLSPIGYQRQWMNPSSPSNETYCLSTRLESSIYRTCKCLCVIMSDSRLLNEFNQGLWIPYELRDAACLGRKNNVTSNVVVGDRRVMHRIQCVRLLSNG